MSSRIESNLFGEERGFLLSFKGWWWLSSSSDFGDSDEVFETRCRELFLALVSFEKRRRFFRRRGRFLLVGTLCHHRENKARWQQRERELETYRFYSPWVVALLLFKFFCKNCMDVFSSNDDNENSACRRQRTRRNAKTFERTTWSVCITKKSFNARTRSKRKQTDNAGKKRRRYGPRSRNTSTIRAGER